LDRPPSALGHQETIVFFNDSDRFHWEQPEELCDARSGVVCSPNNFQYDTAMTEGTVRITCLANYHRWKSLEPQTYELEKLRWYDRMVASAVRFIPDFRGQVIATDMFTPTTIARFTGHENGAVYGAPEKQRDGTTHLKNLFVCGADQGLVGIVGSITSGITVTNRYLLA
jgi:phytoene dehydrogenase-like protein